MFWRFAKWIGTFCQYHILMAKIRVLIIPYWDSNHSKFAQGTNHSIVCHRQTSQNHNVPIFEGLELSGFSQDGHNLIGCLATSALVGNGVCALRLATVLWRSKGRGSYPHLLHWGSCWKCHLFKRWPSHSQNHPLRSVYLSTSALISILIFSCQLYGLAAVFWVP